MKISLITRYSVKNPRFMHLAGIDSEQKRSDWLYYRKVLFEEFCLPSVRRQARLPDLWMVLLGQGDEDIAAHIVPQDCPWILPVFVPDALSVGDPFLSFVDERLKLHYSGVSDELLVARLDSDDCIAPTYISDLFAAAERTDESLMHNLFIFTRGVRWNGQQNRILNYKSSPFLATRGVLRADGKSVVNSPFFNHSEAHKRPHHVVSPDKPAWLQVIHGQNISSSLDLTKKYLGSLDNDALYKIFSVGSPRTKFGLG